MSRDRPRPIHPIYLGGPLHGQYVERVYRDAGVAVRAVEPRPLQLHLPAEDIAFNYLTYEPKKFAWTGTLFETIEIKIWVDSRLCEVARDRLMKEIMVRYRWADQLYLNGA